MKQIVFEDIASETITLEKSLAKYSGVIGAQCSEFSHRGTKGILVYEDGQGWIFRNTLDNIDSGWCGHHPTKEQAIKSAKRLGKVQFFYFSTWNEAMNWGIIV